MDIHDSDLGIVGRCDVVRHCDDDKALEVVEYKASPVRRKAEVTFPQMVQLALQCACLRSMGLVVARASVHFTNHGVTVEVPLSSDLLAQATSLVRVTRAIIEAAQAPPPLSEDSRCRFCSHAGVCLPDENQNRLGPGISASDPDGELLQVVKPGARLQLRAGRLEVVFKDEQLASLPLERVVGVIVHGNVDISSAVVRELLWRRRSVVWCSGRGRVLGWASSADSPNGGIRIKQAALSLQGDLALARQFVASKIGNQATLLRRNGVDVPATIIAELRGYARTAGAISSNPELFATEGRAAAVYFANFDRMVRGHGAWALDSWTGRSGRHAEDALNVAMNYVYGLLTADCIRAIVACGLDPSGGFLHSSSRNKPALALDLMEEFRAPLADSALLRAINNGELQSHMLERSLGDSRLTDNGRRVLVKAYEARASAEIRHPSFGYVTTWRRAIEIQARMILGYLDGTQSGYKGMRTR